MISKTALILSLIAGASPARALTLSEAVSEAAARSPAVSAAGAREASAASMERQALAARFPRLGLYGGVVNGDDPVYVFGSLLRQGGFGAQNFAIPALNDPDPLTDYTGGVQVSVPLFTGFEISGRQAAGGLAREMAQAAVSGSRERTRHEVLSAFLRFLWLDEQAKAVSARVESAAAELASAEKLNQTGLILGSDYEAARAIHAGLKVRGIRTEAAREAARAELAARLGKDPAEVSPDGALRPAAYELLPLREYVSSALSRRADMRAASARVRIARAMRRTADASILPRIEAFGAVETHSRNLASNPASRVAGLRASLPIGDPGYPWKRAQARAELEESGLEKEAVGESVRIQVGGAFAVLRGIIESLPAAENAAARAREALERFRPLYRKGRQSVLDVLRAEEGLALAESARLETVYRLHEGYSALLLASGMLDEAGISEISRRLEEERR